MFKKDPPPKQKGLTKKVDPRLRELGLVPDSNLSEEYKDRISMAKEITTLGIRIGKLREALKYYADITKNYGHIPGTDANCAKKALANDSKLAGGEE